MTGLTGLTQAVAEQKAKQAAFKENGGNFPRYAKFVNDQIYTVRFLEQGDDVQWAWVHELPKEPGKSYGGVTPCLNQDGRGAACPGCEMGVKRKIQGWINIIMRDAPMYQKGPDGKLLKNPITQGLTVVGNEDQVFVWNSGSNLFNLLGTKDKAFKGLMSRDFHVVKTGEGFGTSYSIEPADVDSGPQKMTAADKELAANKSDTRLFTMPESYDIAKQLLMGVPQSAIQRENGNGPVRAGAGNLFTQAIAEQNA